MHQIDERQLKMRKAKVLYADKKGRFDYMATDNNQSNHNLRRP